jgi:hypothetical protein
MKATKYTLTIKLEALSLDCFPSLLDEALKQMYGETYDCKIYKDDGDSLELSLDKTPVEF